LTIDPTHAEAGTAELNITPANTIATSDIDTTMSTERLTAQNSAIAVVGDNESPAVSVSNSARPLTIHLLSLNFVIRSTIDRSIGDRSKKRID